MTTTSTSTSTEYDYERRQHLVAAKKERVAAGRAILDRAKAEGRDLDGAEHDAVEAAVKAAKRLDTELADQNRAMLKAFGEVAPGPGQQPADQRQRFLTLRGGGVKAGLTARFGAAIGTPGMKSLVDTTDPGTYVSLPMDATPIRMGQAPTSLLEVLPAVRRPVIYQYMRQTTRTNNAGPVASGGLKPTSVYGLTPVEGRLHVIAHISEPIDKYVLADAPSLGDFVKLEMVDGLHAAVEAQIVSGDGTGENLTGLAHTSGIQIQSYATSPVLTARAAITKVEVLGFTPYYVVVNPSDWEKIETSTLTGGDYALNADGQRNGLPVDSAARRLWGVPVTVSTAVPAGTGYLLSDGVVQVTTDGGLDAEVGGISDDFQRNQVRLRVEGRFGLDVTRPNGVVKMALASA